MTASPKSLQISSHSYCRSCSKGSTKRSLSWNFEQPQKIVFLKNRTNLTETSFLVRHLLFLDIVKWAQTSNRGQASLTFVSSHLSFRVSCSLAPFLPLYCTPSITFITSVSWKAKLDAFLVRTEERKEITGSVTRKEGKKTKTVRKVN